MGQIFEVRADTGVVKAKGFEDLLLSGYTIEKFISQEFTLSTRGHYEFKTVPFIEEIFETGNNVIAQVNSTQSFLQLFQLPLNMDNFVGFRLKLREALTENVIDDMEDVTDWTEVDSGWGITMSLDTSDFVQGLSSMRVDVSRNSTGSYVYKDFGVNPLDLSNMLYIQFDYKQSVVNTSTGIRFYIRDVNANLAYADILVNNQNTWERKYLKKEDFITDTGFDWSQIQRVYFYVNVSGVYYTFWVDYLIYLTDSRPLTLKVYDFGNTLPTNLSDGIQLTDELNNINILNRQLYPFELKKEFFFWQGIIGNTLTPGNWYGILLEYQSTINSVEVKGNNNSNVTNMKSYNVDTTTGGLTEILNSNADFELLIQTDAKIAGLYLKTDNEVFPIRYRLKNVDTGEYSEYYLELYQIQQGEFYITFPIFINSPKRHIWEIHVENEIELYRKFITGALCILKPG